MAAYADISGEMRRVSMPGHNLLLRKRCYRGIQTSLHMVLQPYHPKFTGNFLEASLNDMQPSDFSAFKILLLGTLTLTDDTSS